MKLKKIGNNIILHLIVFTSFVIILFECSTVPKQTQEEWAKESNITITNLQDSNFDTHSISQLLDDISTGRWINVHGLLIIQDRNLIAEGYWNGSNPSKPHDIRSAGKSIASILIGIAIDQNYINSVYNPVYDYFPEYEPSFLKNSNSVNWDLWKNELTIEHLLNMTSGYEYDDWFDNFRGEYEIGSSSNWVRKAAKASLIKRPGTFYAYNSGSLVLLSDIISRSSAMSTLDFAEQYLFQPLNIQGWKWRNKRGVVYMGGNLWITLRDMAIIGLLMVNNGIWNDQQILSTNWITKIQTELTKSEPSWRRHNHYHHYLWWAFDEEINKSRVRAFFAQGNGGQIIFYVPKHKIVIAMTTGNYNSSLEPQSIQIIREVILPALLQDIEILK